MSYLQWNRSAQQCVAEAGDESVILIGGFGGYSNFGDVLQLQGAIDFHRTRTGLNPIVLIHASSFDTQGDLEALSRGLGVDRFLVWSPFDIDLDAFALSPVVGLPPVRALHLYGGGIMTPTWGPEFIRIINLLFDTFHPTAYVISGQQILPAFAGAFQAHVKERQPALMGARDHLSVSLLQAMDAPSAYSFDDACERMSILVRQVKEADLARAQSTILLHMNASPYAIDMPVAASVETFEARLSRIAHRDEGRESRLVALNAYSRGDAVIDTLAMIKLMASRFPFPIYTGVNLSDLLYQSDPSALLADAVGRPSAVYTSSYHVAMMGGMMGAPTFLWSKNDYYDQKRAGLGLQCQDLDTFFARQERADVEPWFEARKAWLERLEAVLYDARKRPMKATGASSPKAPYPPKNRQPWRPRPNTYDRLGELERDLQASRAEIAAMKEGAGHRAPLSKLRAVARRLVR